MKVKLGNKASIFHSANLGITIKKNQVVELNAYKSNSVPIRNAINGGFLVVVKDEKYEPEVNLKEKFTKLVKSGVSEDKLKKTFNLAQLKEIAAGFDIEVEESDTKDSILEAIMSDEEFAGEE